jgi:DNA primase
MDVLELLNKEEVRYSPSGQDYLIKCLNPEHDDSNPSLRVDKVTGVMHCFSCGFKGNVFTHFDVPGLSSKDMKVKKIKGKIENRRLENVGLQIPTASMRFVGTFKNISPDILNRYEAFTYHEKGYAGRLLFPIRDVTGKIRSFLGRAMEPTTIPKYMIYPRGARMPFFPPLPYVIEGTVILVEGIFDALNLIDKGLDNAVCCFGTNNVDIYKLSLLKVLGVKGIHILFDGDDAGRKGAKTTSLLCEELDLATNIIPIQNNIDPGDLLRERVQELRKYLYG